MRSNLAIVSLVVAVIGIVLIVLSEVAGLVDARIFGAGLISLGGIGVGVVAGLGDVRPGRWLGRLRDARVAIGVALAVVLVLPVLAGLVGAIVGFFSAVGSGLNPVVVSVGGLLALLFLAMTVRSTWISVQAVRRTELPTEVPQQVTAGEERT